MTAALVVLIVAAFITLRALALATDRLYGDEDQADKEVSEWPDRNKGATPHEDGQPDAMRANWLPVTRLESPQLQPLWQPRIGVGRFVTVTDLTAGCGPAGWPVASFPAGSSWQAQRGTA